MSRDALLGLLVFAVALLLRVAFVCEYESKLALDVRRLDQTDNHTFDLWARSIASGDLLGRKPIHAYHQWTAEVAPESRWLRWYGDPLTFHQSPLYPYFVAGVYRLFGSAHRTIGFVQAFLGALTCLLVFVLARRLGGLVAATAAGGLLALCGPYFLYDVFLLRDGWLALFTVLVALALDRMADRRRLRDFFVAGVALGLFALAKETGPALFALTAALWLLFGRGPLRRRAADAVLVAAGFLLALSPAIARNLAVGAPALRFSTRGPEVFVTGNVVGEDGLEWSPPAKDLRTILSETDFSLPATMARTVMTHRPEPTGWPVLLWNKTRAFFNGHEIPNNVNYYLVEAHCTTLKAGFVTLTWLSPLALLGAVVSFARWRRRAPLLLLFGALCASVVALYVIARFRVHVLPLFALFGGLFVAWCWRAWREGGLGRLAAAGAAFATLTWWCAPEVDASIRGLHRYAIPMHKHLVTMDLEHAERFRREARRFAEERGMIPYDPDTVEQFERIDEAFERLRRSAAMPEDSPQRYLERAEAYARLAEITKKGLQRQLADLAVRNVRKALDLDPDVEGAHRVWGDVLRAIQHPREALHHYAIELDRHPGDVETLVRVGHHLFQRGNLPDALVYYERALAAGCDDPLVLVRSAQVLIDPRCEGYSVPLLDGSERKAHDPEAAVRRIEVALRRWPDDPEILEPAARVFYARGMLFGEVEWVDRAIALLERLRSEFFPESQRIESVLEGFRRLRERRFGAPPAETSGEGGGEPRGS